MAERLQKVMAQAGVASRRKAESMITDGEVKVNGKVVKELGTKVTDKDTIIVNGVPISKEEHVYYLLYKPRGVVTTVKDDKKRKTVLDFFENVSERIYPVGRLDYDTSGLLLLTNDGELDNRLTHPKYEFEKNYVAKVKGIVSNNDLKQLRVGVRVDDRKSAPAKVKLIKTNEDAKTSIVSLTIHEGRNHQVKKMFAAAGLPVQKLSRIQYGTLTLDGLPTGQFRRLSKKEVSQLINAAQGN